MCFSPAFMTITEIWREIQALPDLTAVPKEGATTAAAAKETAAIAPLQLVVRQRQMLLRLATAAEALERRNQELTDLARKREAVFTVQLQEKNQDLRNNEARLAQKTTELTAELNEARRNGETQTRKIALEAIRLMDALDWVHEALSTRGDVVADLSRELASAQRDCLRRLASVGIEEIPAVGRIDVHLHEGMDVAAPDTAGGVPQYHIVRVVRRGWRSGAEILRRASVVTAG